MNSANIEEISINVTQEHIDQGKRGNCSHCPIALAFLDRVVKETYGPTSSELGFRVAVTSDIYWNNREGTESFATLPWEAHEFMNLFDNGGNAKPFSFKTLIFNFKRAGNFPYYGPF